jgi:hypothetical protein
MPQDYGTHPEISSLIKKRDAIHELIYTQHNYREAIDNMLGLIWELEPQDQEKEEVKKLIEKLENTTAMFIDTRSASINRQRESNLAMPSRRYLREVNGILWRGKYLSNEKYSGIIPTSTMKTQIEPPKKKVYDEKLPSELL